MEYKVNGERGRRISDNFRETKFFYNGESSICQFIKDRNGELVRSRKKLVENARKKKQVYLGFMDLEKAYL